MDASGALSWRMSALATPGPVSCIVALSPALLVVASVGGAFGALHFDASQAGGWDLSQATLSFDQIPRFHTASVRDMSRHPSLPGLVASGGHDGTVAIIDWGLLSSLPAASAQQYEQEPQQQLPRGLRARIPAHHPTDRFSTGVVSSLKWDPRSSAMLSLTTDEGYWSLVDTRAFAFGAAQIVARYETPAARSVSLFSHSWCPGSAHAVVLGRADGVLEVLDTRLLSRGPLLTVADLCVSRIGGVEVRDCVA